MSAWSRLLNNRTDLPQIPEASILISTSFSVKGLGVYECGFKEKTSCCCSKAWIQKDWVSAQAGKREGNEAHGIACELLW